MAAGNLVDTANILASTLGDYYIDDMDALPNLAMMLEEHHKFETAAWVMNFYRRLIEYRESEYDMVVSVNNGGHLCEKCQD